MGNQHSSVRGTKKLAIHAVAKRMEVDRSTLIHLRNECFHLADRDDNISFDSFDTAMRNVRIQRPEDREILDLLFTMWDSEGDEAIPVHNFMVGISPLACKNERLSDVLRFALVMGDTEDTGRVSRQELDIILQSILDIAAYFGDDTINFKTIRRITDFVFLQRPRQRVPHAYCVERLVENIHVQKFVEGRLKSTVSFSSNVRYPKRSFPLPPSPSSLPTSPSSMMASLRVDTSSYMPASATAFAARPPTPSPRPISILKTSTVKSRSVHESTAVGNHRTFPKSPQQQQQQQQQKAEPESPFAFVESFLSTTPSCGNQDINVDDSTSFFSFVPTPSAAACPRSPAPVFVTTPTPRLAATQCDSMFAFPSSPSSAVGESLFSFDSPRSATSPTAAAH